MPALFTEEFAGIFSGKHYESKILNEMGMLMIWNLIYVILGLTKEWIIVI